MIFICGDLFFRRKLIFTFCDVFLQQILMMKIFIFDDVFNLYGDYDVFYHGNLIFNDECFLLYLFRPRIFTFIQVWGFISLQNSLMIEISFSNFCFLIRPLFILIYFFLFFPSFPSFLFSTSFPSFPFSISFPFYASFNVFIFNLN